jgi:hypothetical protein
LHSFFLAWSWSWIEDRPGNAFRCLTFLPCSLRGDTILILFPHRSDIPCPEKLIVCCSALRLKTAFFL